MSNHTADLFAVEHLDCELISLLRLEPVEAETPNDWLTTRTPGTRRQRQLERRANLFLRRAEEEEARQ
jgi:hypothetical protein